MSKKLKCIHCNKFLGTVDKGALSPSFNAICTECLPRKANISCDGMSGDDALNHLKDIFGMDKGK